MVRSISNNFNALSKSQSFSTSHSVSLAQFDPEERLVYLNLWFIIQKYTDSIFSVFTPEYGKNGYHIRTWQQCTLDLLMDSTWVREEHCSQK